MHGTIRSFDKETLDVMKKRIKTIAENVAAAYECTADVKLED